MKLIKCPTLVTGNLLRVLGCLSHFPLQQRYFAVCEHFLAFHSSVGHLQNQSSQIYASSDRLLFYLGGNPTEMITKCTKRIFYFFNILVVLLKNFNAVFNQI